jgi:hypothetical protein
MPLKPVPYRSLRALLRRELLTEEHAATAALIRRLAHVEGTGRFTRAEFLAMCRWKSPRSRRHYERNTAGAIRRASVAALATRSERERMSRLIALPGVSVATASAILTLIDPRRYGVLDIRAGSRSASARGGNERGRASWLHSGKSTWRLRPRARPRRLRAMIEHSFHCHRKLQRGRLYD